MLHILSWLITLVLRRCSARVSAMSGSWVQVDRKAGGYAIVSLCKEPANTLDFKLWQQLANAIQQLEHDASVRGVVITSGLKRDIFSAGNDIMALYAPKTSKDAYKKFWVTQNQFLARLYRSPLVTISAIRGACPAGGCAISMCCDMRIMSEQGHIGLNEVALGISVPAMWAILMSNTIGQGKAEQMLEFAKLVTPQEALQIGLTDQVVPKEELLSTAEAVMQKLLQAGPDAGRQATKMHLREKFSREWEAFCVPEVDGAWEQLAKESTVKAMAGVLEGLAKRKRSKL